MLFLKYYLLKLAVEETLYFSAVPSPQGHSAKKKFIPWAFKMSMDFLEPSTCQHQLLEHFVDRSLVLDLQPEKKDDKVFEGLKKTCYTLEIQSM